MFQFNTGLIKRKLDEYNMNQRMLAEKTEVSTSTISSIITNNHKTISLEFAWKICQTLNIKISDLIVHDEPVEKTANDLLEDTRRYLSKLNDAFSLYYACNKICNSHNNEDVVMISSSDCGEDYITQEDIDELRSTWVSDFD